MRWPSFSIKLSDFTDEKNIAVLIAKYICTELHVLKYVFKLFK